MFKKIAQWIRTRQERRLRERLVFKRTIHPCWSNTQLVATTQTVNYILYGTIPSDPAAPIPQDSPTNDSKSEQEIQ